MQLSIRPATEDDAQWLFALHEATMRPRSEAQHGPWNEASQRANFFARTETDIRVVEVDGTAVGAVHLATDDADGALRIGLIEVLPNWQGQGIGSRVIAALDEEAARAGVDLVLRVRHGNRARQLYERLGFTAEAEDATHTHMRRR